MRAGENGFRRDTSSVFERMLRGEITPGDYVDALRRKVQGSHHQHRNGRDGEVPSTPPESARKIT